MVLICRAKETRTIRRRAKARRSRPEVVAAAGRFQRRTARWSNETNTLRKWHPHPPINKTPTTICQTWAPPTPTPTPFTFLSTIRTITPHTRIHNGSRSGRSPPHQSTISIIKRCLDTEHMLCHQYALQRIPKSKEFVSEILNLAKIPTEHTAIESFCRGNSKIEATFWIAYKLHGWFFIFIIFNLQRF